VRISNIRINNFVCFRGEHNLKLDAIPYAVTAQHLQDQRRSNWLGKSTFLESIWFALYGEHRWPSEDSWITRGEDEGGVKIEFSNGYSVERYRYRGKATQLAVFKDGTAKQGEAQNLINEVTGLDRQDFDATCYFRQKRMSRFIVAKPAERMQTVVGWLRLERLDDCADATAERMGKMAEGVSVYQARITHNTNTMHEMMRGLDLTPSAGVRDNVETLNAFIAEHTTEIEQLQGAVGLLENDRDKLVAWQKDEGASDQFKSVSADGVKLKHWLAEVATEDRQQANVNATLAWNEALGRYNMAKRELQTKRALMRGQFDGACPVAGMLCPVKGEINSNMGANNRLYDKACQNEATARLEWEEAQASKVETQRLYQEVTDTDARLAGLRAQALQLRQAANRFAAGAPTEMSLDEVNRLIGVAQSNLAQTKERKHTKETVLKRIHELSEDTGKATTHIKLLQTDLTVAREANLVFKRSRQRIAETALSSIETGANALLQESNIDLSITARWQREGEGLADACDKCGAPFGTSRKVKVCGRCGEARGPKMVNKLELVLSNVSGAAEDLGGGAFQLSASAWLRRMRACAWSVALIDEPFGALDESNRDAFAAHLNSILRGAYGFDQAFVVSHSPGTMEAMPGRIVIKSDGKHSSLHVD